MEEKEYKELLLRDICSRLPYGVKVQVCNLKDYAPTVKGLLDNELYSQFDHITKPIKNGDSTYNIINDNVKPYLRSVKNMTEKEVKDLVKVKILSKYGKENDYGGLNNIKSIKNFWFSSMHNQWFCDVTFNTIDGKCTQCFSVGRVTWETTIAEIDWLNKNKFDYRGLIPKGIALEAPKDMYNKI